VTGSRRCFKRLFLHSSAALSLNGDKNVAFRLLGNTLIPVSG
jgi:hypothetical protein